MKTTLNKQLMMTNLQKIAEKTTRGCDLYRLAWKMIEIQGFENYDNSEFLWFQLFFDGLDRQWCVEEKVSKNKCEWILTRDGEEISPLGTYSKFIENFIEQKKEEQEEYSYI
jgi:hypothetical protein